MFDIVTFGSAVVDVFVDTNMQEKDKKICYPVGSKILLKNLKFDIGGGGTNTAVAFSRLGLKTGYIGKIGDDFEGKKILDMLKKAKIKFLGKIQKNAISGYSIILDSKENNRTILTYKGINNNIFINDIKKFRTKWLYFSSVMGKSFDSQKKLIKKLIKQGTKLVFNPSEYLIKRKNLSELIKNTSLLILNKQEAELLCKKKAKTEELLKKLFSMGPEIVVITDKNKKVEAYDGIKFYREKPHKIKVIERTGAGDAFASGFAGSIICGKNIQESLKFGIKESESVIKYFGAKNNLLKKKLK